MDKPILSVDDLEVKFVEGKKEIHAVNGVSFELFRGEALGILGESGSGKSVTLRALLGLLPTKKTRIRGHATLEGTDLLNARGRALADLRGNRLSMIFQEPASALDPIYTIGDQIAETLIRHEGIEKKAAWTRAVSLLDEVQIPSAAQRAKAYPHEMSGGMLQRSMIALALACRPSVLFADEPTTALDVSVQIQILLLLRQLQQERGMAIIFVSHDLGVINEISDRVAVMYAGRFVETGDITDVFSQPHHPYTTGLLGATIGAAQKQERLTTIPGMPPNLAELPPGCSFAPRCAYAQPSCEVDFPPLHKLGERRAHRCLRVARGEIALHAPHEQSAAQQEN